MDANQVDDILTNDLSGVDTRNPVLPKGRVKLRVKKVEQKVNTENQKKSVNIQLILNQTAVSTDGQQLQAGHIMFDAIAITPTEKWTADDIKKQLKKFQEAVGVTGSFHPLEQYEGRELEADMTISPAKDGYPERNRFNYVKKAA